MKANQKFVETEEAVSPVIGVILMVAITVVLAAVVFVLVSNLSEGGDQAPTMGFSKDESADRLNLISADAGLDWSQFNIVMDQPGFFELNSAADTTAGTDLVAGTPVAIGTAPAPVSAGNFIGLCGDTTAAANVRIVHIETNTQVYETTFSTLTVCAA